MTIIDRIKSIRKKENLSQAGFAKEIGYSQSYIKDIELGKTKPSRNVLEAISHRWDISIDWLLKGEDKYLRKSPKYPHFRDIVLVAYEGKDKEKIEKLLSEGEYTLLESLIAANTIHVALDASKQDKRIEDFILRGLALVSSQPEYKNDDLLHRLEDCILTDDITGLKKLATFAFIEEPEPDTLQHYFFQLFSTFLENWDFDFNTFTLKIKLYHHEFKPVPLVISEPQLLFSDDTIDLSNKLTGALLNTIKEIDSSLTPDQRKLFYEILTAGIEVLTRQVIDKYLREIR